MDVDIVRKFYDNNVEKLSERNARHDWVLKSLDSFIPRNVSTLDIGCGAGITSRHLAEGNRSVTAVDLSPALIAYARQENNHDNIRYIASDIADYVPEPGQKFDAVTMVDVLEHLMPETVLILLATILMATHDDSSVYVNVPVGETTKWLVNERPSLLQVIDRPISIETILAWFRSIYFVPLIIRQYSLQYIEFLFITESRMSKLLSTAYPKEVSHG